jgi:hypothetical protein
MERTLGDGPARQANSATGFYLATHGWLYLNRKSLIAAILGFLASLTFPAGFAGAHAKPVRVMTQNLYLGSNLSPLSTAKTTAELRMESILDQPLCELLSHGPPFLQHLRRRLIIGFSRNFICEVPKPRGFL